MSHIIALHIDPDGDVGLTICETTRPSLAPASHGILLDTAQHFDPGTPAVVLTDMGFPDSILPAWKVAAEFCIDVAERAHLVYLAECDKGTDGISALFMAEAYQQDAIKLSDFRVYDFTRKECS